MFTIATILVICSSIASFFIHLNNDVYTVLFNTSKPYENIYTDIVDGIYKPLFMNRELCRKAITGSGDVDRWFDREFLANYCVNGSVYPLPYRDYKFEYPPITGFLWIISTYTAYSLSGLNNTVGETIHYIIQSIALSIACIWVFIEFYRIGKKIGVSHRLLKLLLFPLLPSLLVYSIYNWDLIAAAFTLTSIRLFIEKKYLFSGLFIGLGISAKLLPLSIALVLGYELYASKSYKLLARYAIGTCIGLTPYLVFILYPHGFIEFIRHHAGWYCENCIYMYIISDIWSQYHRVLALMSIAIALTIIAILPYKSGDKGVVGKACLAISFTIVLNYVFSPQMILLTTPFILLAITSIKELVTYLIADTLNSLIMIYWFKELELRKTLSFLGIPIKYSPWTPDSPIQLMALIRSLLLIIVLLAIAWKTLSLTIGTETIESSIDTESSGESGSGADIESRQ